MSKKGKKYKKVAALVDRTNKYNVTQACDLVGKTKTAKFDESVDLAVHLGVDPKHAEQMVRGFVSLPHGIGKNVRVAVFAKGPKAQEAQAAGAEIVGAEDLAAKVEEGFCDFDKVVATPDMMIVVGKLGKVLGPRGLMPNPKLGTVTMDVAKAVTELKSGKIEFKVEKGGTLHAPVGRASFAPAKLAENTKALLEAIMRAKPAALKGQYIKKMSLSCTMGPGITLDNNVAFASSEA